MIWKSVLRRFGDPFFEVHTLFCSCFPDCLEPGSTPAKAVNASRCVKRVTSPISAISCGPREGPTPCIAMTTGYSGRAEAVSSIFRRRDSTVADAALSIATACRISTFVVLSFGNTAIRSEDLLYIVSALLALKL